MSTASLAVIAGTGGLPATILSARPGHLVHFDGAEPSEASLAAAQSVIPARFEKMGALFAALKAAGVSELCFAGSMGRPALDLKAMDLTSLSLAPKVMPILAGRDDSLLRVITAIFEERGFAVRGAHELVPGLTAEAGALVGKPSKTDHQDAERGQAILAALGDQDVGQACVVVRNACVGIETAQGTDVMLRFVADTRPGDGAGVLIKRPKPTQDLRLDMPVIGPDTVAGASAAGLAGICIEAGRVMILERDATLNAARAAGLTIWAV